MSRDLYRLVLSCANRPWIVAAVSSYLFQGGCNVRDAQQFDDVHTGRFFMRVLFDGTDAAIELNALRAGFEPIAARFGMTWTMRAASERQRVMLLVS